MIHDPSNILAAAAKRLKMHYITNQEETKM